MAAYGHGPVVRGPHRQRVVGAQLLRHVGDQHVQPRDEVGGGVLQQPGQPPLQHGPDRIPGGRVHGGGVRGRGRPGRSGRGGRYGRGGVAGRSPGDLREPAAHLPGGRGPVVRVLREQAEHQGVQRGRQPLAQRTRRGRRGGEVLREQLVHLAGGEGPAARQQLRQHAAEGVQVGPAVDGDPVRAAGPAFRRHVGEGTDDHPGGRQLRTGGAVGLGDPEVEDLDHPALGDHHVGRLDVPVDDPGVVRGPERVRDPPGPLQGVGERWQAVLQRLGEAAALEQLHHQEHGVAPGAFGAAEVVDGGDVGVREVPGETRLPLEPPGVLGGFGIPDLHRDPAAHPGVLGPPDLAEAAPAEQLVELVTPLDDLLHAARPPSPRDLPPAAELSPSRGPLPPGTSGGTPWTPAAAVVPAVA